MLMIIFGMRLMMFRVNRATVLMRLQHRMHLRIKKKNEIPYERHRTTQVQPLRFVFSRSHSQSVSSLTPRPSSCHGAPAQACSASNCEQHRRPLRPRPLKTTAARPFYIRLRLT